MPLGYRFTPELDGGASAFAGLVRNLNQLQDNLLRELADVDGGTPWSTFDDSDEIDGGTP